MTILNTDVEQIVDFDKNLVGINWILLLVFENNSKLRLGHKDDESRLETLTTEFKQHGAKQFFGSMFRTTNLIFSNFSSSLRDIYDKNNSDKNPWEYFNVGSDLTLQGSFIDFPDLQYFEALTVTIRDVISINNEELLPNNFLTDAGALNRISIINSLHVTIPKFYLERVYRSKTPDSLKLSMELEIANVQKDSLAGRNASRLLKLNHVEINNEMREILNSEGNFSGCSIFCISQNGSAVECSDLFESEKKACGICVRNIVGYENLMQRLKQVCSILELNTTSKPPILDVPTFDKTPAPSQLTTSSKKTTALAAPADTTTKTGKQYKFMIFTNFFRIVYPLLC